MNPRWERLRDTLAVRGVGTTVNSRHYPGGVNYSITIDLAPGVTVDVRDQWWSKNLDVWIGWDVCVTDPEGIIVRSWPRTKKRSEVADAVVAGLAFHVEAVR